MKYLTLSRNLLLALTAISVLSSCSLWSPRSQMRSKEVTKEASFTNLPSPDKTGKVKAEDLLIWCLKELDTKGDINARMQRVRDAE